MCNIVLTLLQRAQLTAAQRSSIKASYAAAGIKLMVSAFGATDVPTSSGYDPVSFLHAEMWFLTD